MVKSVGESENVLVCSAAMLRPSDVIALLLRQYSVNVTCTGQDGFRIIEHSGMSSEYLHWAKFLHVIIGCCSYMCAVQLIRGVCHLDISFYLPIQGHQVPLLCWLEYGVGGKGLQDATILHVQSLLAAFMDISLRSVRLIDEVLFVVKSKNCIWRLIGPCIVIYFYGKTNQMHQFLKFILFWNNTLHVSDGLSIHRQEFKTVHFHLVPASEQATVSVWHIPVAVCTVLNSWWWTERPSETCRVLFQNKINLRNWCIWLVLL